MLSRFIKRTTSGDIECTLLGYISAHYKPYCDFNGTFGLMNHIFKWYRFTSTVIGTKWGGVAMRSYENGEAWRSGLMFDKREIGEGYYTNSHHSLVPPFSTNTEPAKYHGHIFTPCLKFDFRLKSFRSSWRMLLTRIFGWNWQWDIKFSMLQNVPRVSSNLKPPADQCIALSNFVQQYQRIQFYCFIYC